MSEWTPEKVERDLTEVMDRIERGREAITKLNNAASQARLNYDLAYARAVVKATGANAEVRKAMAVLAVEDELSERAVTEAALENAKGRMADLKVFADILRSIGTSVRESMR